MKITVEFDAGTLERIEWERSKDRWRPFWTTNGHRFEHDIEEPQQVLWEIALILRGDTS